MYEVDGIVYASNPGPDLLVESARYVGNQQMVVTFNSGETRLLDATDLLAMPAFAPLADEGVLRSFEIDHGVICWLDGEIDIAPEAVYATSYQYKVPA